MTAPDVTVVGGGLAGCEAAWQLAERGVRVSLVEMKPSRMSPAHQTPLLAELVCSNSLRSDGLDAPAGLLKAELRLAGSLILSCADATRVPAGEALAVDRHQFARRVTTAIALHRNIRLERRALDDFPSGPVIIAGGPLVGAGLARRIRALAGDRLYFYDAIAPIVDATTIDWNHAFLGSRYGKRHAEDSDAPTVEGDYVNCPMSEDEYRKFVDEVRRGRKVTPHAFEEPRYFDGCLPIEVMAERGDDVLAFGPMKPVGLTDPRPDRPRPFAVVQLRAENKFGTAYNLVGFQTRLAYPEQKRIFALIPALARAEFLRFGSIHRNAYVDSPRLLDSELRLHALPDVRFAGQITGVEGYIESTAMGLLVALFVAARLRGETPLPPPETTALGGLHYHVTRPRQPSEHFAPMNINFGLLPPLDSKAKKRDRRTMHAERARAAIAPWLARVMTTPPIAA